MSGPTSVEEIVNQALDRIGWPEQIGNIYDGTKQSRIALNAYADTRDALLRSKDWPFAFRQAPAVAGGVIPNGWTYSWTYPADCLRVRDVQPAALFPELDPQPVLWTIVNNGTVKAILTQTAIGYINYIGQVLEITQWDPGFVEAMIEALAAKLGFTLRESLPPAVDPERALELATGADEPQAPNDAAVAAPAQRGRAA